MSSLLVQTVTLRTFTSGTTAGGQPKRELDSETTVAANLQPDTSQEAEFQRIRNGVIAGKLYVSADTTINHETMTVRDSSSNDWEIEGPPVLAADATTKWVTIRRRVLS